MNFPRMLSSSWPSSSLLKMASLFEEEPSIGQSRPTFLTKCFSWVHFMRYLGGLCFMAKRYGFQLRIYDNNSLNEKKNVNTELLCCS